MPNAKTKYCDDINLKKNQSDPTKREISNNNHKKKKQKTAFQ